MFDLSLSRPRVTTLLLALAACLLLAPNALAHDDDPVVIEVGERVITLSDFDERFMIVARNVAMQQGIPFSEEMLEQLRSLRPTYLEQLSTEVVLLHEADQRGITISEEELDAQLEELKANFPDEETFVQVLNQAGFDDEGQFRRLIQEDMLVSQLVDDIRAEIEVTDEALEAFYEDNQAQFETPEEVCARHILVESEEEAEALKAELAEGADFAELAEEHSTDPGSGQRGGDLGCLARGMTVPPFEEAAFTAELDDVTEPVESQFGHHLILVYERREAGLVPFEEVREQITEELQRGELNARIEALSAEAEIEIYPERLEESLDAVEEDLEEELEEVAPDPAETEIDSEPLEEDDE